MTVSKLFPLLSTKRQTTMTEFPSGMPTMLSMRQISDRTMASCL